MSIRELLEQANKLNPSERLELVDALLLSIDHPDPAIEGIWLEEAEWRLAAHRAGTAPGIPFEKVFQEC